MTERPHNTADNARYSPATRPAASSLRARLSPALRPPRLFVFLTPSLCLCVSVASILWGSAAQRLRAQPTDNPDRARIARQPVSVVLINNSAGEAIKMLSAAAGGISIRFAPNVDLKALHPLTISAREVPFYQVLSQIAMLEGLSINPTQGGFMLTRAQASRAQATRMSTAPAAGVDSIPGSSGSFPGDAQEFSGGGFTGSALGAGGVLGAGGAFGGGVPGGAGGYPGMSAALVPIPGGALSQSSAIASQATGLVLQYVLNYARDTRPGMAPPEQVFPYLNSREGALEYIAVVTEALTELTLPPPQAAATLAAPAPTAPNTPSNAPPGAATASNPTPGNAAGNVAAGNAAAASPAAPATPSNAPAAAPANDPVSRLRVLLGQAEGLYDRISRRERLEVEIEVLTARLSSADPSIQPFLTRVLQSRRQALANLAH